MMFKFLLVMILFNVAASLIAATGFFGETVLYGDMVSTDPDALPTTEAFINNMFDPIPTLSIPVIGEFMGDLELNWASLTAGIFVFAVIVGVVTKSTPTVIPAGVVGSIFILMWANSKTVFEKMTGSLDSLVLYIVLMIGVGFFFIVLIAIMDYLSGQDSG